MNKIFCPTFKVLIYSLYSINCNISCVCSFFHFWVWLFYKRITNRHVIGLVDKHTHILEKVKDILMTLVYEAFLKTFYEEKKNWFFLIVFYIFHKRGSKTFLKLSINKYLKRTYYLNLLWSAPYPINDRLPNNSHGLVAINDSTKIKKSFTPLC